MRPKGSAAELEQRRRQAISLLEQGLKAIQVAKAVGASPASVTRWRQAYESQGRAALSAKPHPGRRPKLTAKQRERLGKLLLKGPAEFGYSTELWTLARVAEVIAVAKRDLEKGEQLVCSGGYTVNGLCEEADGARGENLLPLGLAYGVKMKEDVAKGIALTYEMVEFNQDSSVLKLRRLQDATLW